MNRKKDPYGLVQYQDGDLDEKEREEGLWLYMGLLPK